jgi:hypothetical protein
LLAVLLLVACAGVSSDLQGQARSAFEKAVATDTNNLNSISLPSNASDSQAKQAFAALASETLRFKGDVQSITYPENTKADVDKLASDLSDVADFAKRISAVMSQLAAGAKPTDVPSATAFCSAIRQQAADANAVFNDLRSNQQYKLPAVGCG